VLSLSDERFEAVRCKWDSIVQSSLTRCNLDYVVNPNHTYVSTRVYHGSVPLQVLRRVLSLSDERFEAVRCKWDSLLAGLRESSVESAECFKELQDASDERCQVNLKRNYINMHLFIDVYMHIFIYLLK